MIIPEVAVFRWDETPLDKVTEMVACKRVQGAELSLTQAYLKKGAIVPLHADAAEQLIYVLQGAVRARVAGVDVTVREGEVIVVAAGTRHQIETLDDTFLLTIGRAAPPA